MKKRIFLTYSLLLPSLLIVLYPAAVCRSASYPQPQGYVNDFAGIIDQGTNQKLTSFLREVEQKTSAQIAVVSVQSLNNDSIENYANELYSRWKIGQKGKDNGVLILVAVEERRVRIEVGYGLEGILPDGICGAIIRDNIIPFFKQGNYGKGLVSGTYAVAQIIGQDAGVTFSGTNVPQPEDVQVHLSPFASLIGLLVFIVIFIIFVRHPFLFLLFFMGSGRGGGSWGSGGGGFSGGSGGFGGVGGGFSGGGGASGRW
jgi:uncharacterized protein